jgi:hypothetical protein
MYEDRWEILRRRHIQAVSLFLKRRNYQDLDNLCIRMHESRLQRPSAAIKPHLDDHQAVSCILLEAGKEAHTAPRTPKHPGNPTRPQIAL